MNDNVAFRAADFRVRAISVGLTVALHLAILLSLLLVAQPRISPASPVSAALNVTFSRPVRHLPTPPQLHPVPSPSSQQIALVPPVLVVNRDDRLAAALSQQTDTASGSCDLTAAVQAALRGDPTVQVQLPNIPAAQRSDANAIDVWNHGWIKWNQGWIKVSAQSMGADQRAYRAIRDTVAQTIIASSPACRAQPQAGPRLIYLPNVDFTGTTVLAFGSGYWTWQQVADTATAKEPLSVY